MMTAATQNSALFGSLYSLLLVVNVLGVGAAGRLILLSVRRLVRAVPRPGHGLAADRCGCSALFVLLTVIPVLVVYLFSVQALNRGIDNWFDVRIEQRTRRRARCSAVPRSKPPRRTWSKRPTTSRSRSTPAGTRPGDDRQPAARTVRGVRAHAVHARRQGVGVEHLGARCAASPSHPTTRARRYSPRCVRASNTSGSNRSAPRACRCGWWCR
ncbi:MAG: hypothetical protein MZV65_54525 [Chromatiales bacterium]|nr:hypothetical protein [Chromatiales bacterium]